MYAVIMAGGKGTRLWPQSVSSRAKQFQPICSERTLLQETADKLAPLVKDEDFYVVANASHRQQVTSQLDFMPVENFIGEPIGKNTAPVVGMAAVILRKKDPNAVMLISPSDHTIKDVPKFREILKVAAKVAETRGRTVTIGITPTSPATGYGYIQTGEEFEDVGGIKVLKALRFKEKPDYDTAVEYVRSGSYAWNSGMFMWNVNTVLDLFKTHAPEIYDLLMVYDKAIGTPDEAKVFDEVYHAFPSVSVDNAILEFASEVYVIPADMGWSDLGSWPSIYDIFDKDEKGNAAKGLTVALDCENSLLSSSGGRLIAAVGLEDMIVVDTDKAVLVLPMSKAQQIKDLLEVMKQKGLNEYL